MIDMVDKKALRDINNEAVHIGIDPLLGSFGPAGCDCIICVARLDSVPFIFGQARIVFGINDGESLLR